MEGYARMLMLFMGLSPTVHCDPRGTEFECSDVFSLSEATHTCGDDVYERCSV